MLGGWEWSFKSPQAGLGNSGLALGPGPTDMCAPILNTGVEFTFDNVLHLPKQLHSSYTQWLVVTCQEEGSESLNFATGVSTASVW